MLFLFWLIFFVCLSVCVGAYANRKGHSFFGWFVIAILVWFIIAILANPLLGLISPLLVFLFVAIKKPNRKNLEKKTIANKEMKKCPKCAELIKYAALVCRFCGNEDFSVKEDAAKEI